MNEATGIRLQVSGRGTGTAPKNKLIADKAPLGAVPTSVGEAGAC